MLVTAAGLAFLLYWPIQFCLTHKPDAVVPQKTVMEPIAVAVGPEPGVEPVSSRQSGPLPTSGVSDEELRDLLHRRLQGAAPIGPGAWTAMEIPELVQSDYWQAERARCVLWRDDTAGQYIVFVVLAATEQPAAVNPVRTVTAFRSAKIQGNWREYAKTLTGFSIWYGRTHPDGDSGID